MRKSRHISLQECYTILDIKRDATLDDVKSAYRKRAFELHPDLNPDVPDAGTQFKRLNEAYVALSQILQTEEGKRKAAFKEDERKERNRAERKAQRAKEEAQKEQETRERFKKESQENKERRQAEREKAKQEKAEQERIKQEKAEQEKAEKEKAAKQAAQSSQAYTTYTKADAGGMKKGTRPDKEPFDIKEEARKNHQAAASAAYEKEDVLRDLLHDPFARRVFEDIYSELNKQSQGDATAQPPPSPPPPPPTAEVDLGKSTKPLQTGNGFSGKLKGWLLQQIDEEQTIKMPATALFVGARIRLQIRRGLSEELSTVEIVLPKNFCVGKPIRLRGLGKKVGKWQGDLYLTIETK